MTTAEALLTPANQALLASLPKEGHALFKWFLALTQICRPSHSDEHPTQLDAARLPVIEWGKLLGAEVAEDKGKNIWFSIPATKGCEGAKGLGLQAHLDIVPAGKFQPDGSVKVKLVDGWLTSGESTLGGDDGIGVAEMLAILEAKDTFKHGPLQFIVTMDEETGMYGAIDLSTTLLKVPAVLNLDSEDWGVFATSCAGSVTLDVSFAGEKKPLPKTVTKEFADGKKCVMHGKVVKVALSGLLSGHSGVEIHKGLPNAVKWVSKLLGAVLAEGLHVQLVSIKSGTAKNAIPNSAEVVVSVWEGEFETFNWVLQKKQAELVASWPSRDPPKVGVPFLEVTETEATEAFTPEATVDVFKLLEAVHTGVFTYSPYVRGLVNTSQNIGVVGTAGNKVSLTVFARSNDPALMKFLKLENEKATAGLKGVTITLGEEVGPWLAAPGSPILDQSVASFEKLFSATPVYGGCHAGLECGVFIQKYPDLQCVSIGPDLRDVHTIFERLDVETSVKFDKLVRDIVAAWAAK